MAKEETLLSITINQELLQKLAIRPTDISETEKVRPAVCSQCPFYVFDEADLSHCILFAKDMEKSEAKTQIASFCKLDFLVVRLKGG